MTDIEQWWRDDDSSIFHLRDVPPRGEAAAAQTKNEEAGKPRQASVGEITLNDGRRFRSSLEDAPATAAVHNDPATGAGDQAAQSRDATVAAHGAPGSSSRVVRSKHADEEPPAPAHLEPPPGFARRRSGGLWAAVVILALALGTLAWYGSLILRQNNISLAQLPGMSQLITGLSGRMDATEAKLRDLTNNWGNIQDHVAELDRRLGSNLQLARNQAQALVNEAQTRIEAEVDRNNQAIDGRLSQLEAGRQDDQKRLAELGNQVSGVRQEMSGVRQEIGAGRDETQRDVASLRHQVDQNGNDIRSLGQKIGHQKVTFEATKDRPQQLVPGISMTVTKTNVEYQRFEGYLTLAAGGHTIWLADAGARRSLVFFPYDSSQPYDLVVTAVRPGGVLGYLVVPANQDQGQGSAGGDGAAAAALGL